MAEIEMRIEGVRELQRAFRNYPKIAEPVLQKAINATGAVFAKHTLKNNPVPWRTGNLLQSFRFTSARLQARWFPTAAYAPFVEFGTRPHLILPVNSRVLRWETGGGAGYITSRTGKSYYRSTPSTATFSMHANHPGTKAKPFMRKIVSKSQEDVQRLFHQALDIINREIAKQTRPI